jgi:drug/metabolite transporter (DMT)-like permease
MKQRTLQSDLLLFITAMIWGLAFVAQRVGMKYVGPFTFNGVRFFLGCLPLLPVLLINRLRVPSPVPFKSKTVILGSTLMGLILFAGASLQQIGIVYTTAGKAGFITGLYVVIVPILGLLWRDRSSHGGTWAGAILAAAGMYFLSVTKALTISWGDLLVFFSAFMWAGHVQLAGFLSPKIGAARLAVIQYSVCGGLSLIVALFAENISFAGIGQAAVPILYGGVLSVGVAYTLQLVAQKKAPAAHAAILMSLETVFAALGGWMILGEALSPRALFGCGLILSGMLASQLYPLLKKAHAAESA